MNGMKEGTGDDPYADTESSEENDSAGKPDVQDDNTELSTSEEPTGFDADDVPYVLRRTKVKEDRDDITFPLRPETQHLEQEIDVDIPLSDFRETAYIVGMRNSDEVIQELLSWGYEHRR